MIEVLRVVESGIAGHRSRRARRSASRPQCDEVDALPRIDSEPSGDLLECESAATRPPARPRSRLVCSLTAPSGIRARNARSSSSSVQSSRRHSLTSRLSRTSTMSRCGRWSRRRAPRCCRTCIALGVGQHEHVVDLAAGRRSPCARVEPSHAASVPVETAGRGGEPRIESEALAFVLVVGVERTTPSAAMERSRSMTSRPIVRSVATSSSSGLTNHVRTSASSSR